jgi:AmiR/NasT family two-component response regulator
MRPRRATAPDPDGRRHATLTVMIQDQYRLTPTTEAAAIEAIAPGVSAYLTKPLEPHALLAAVSKAKRR